MKEKNFFRIIFSFASPCKGKMTLSVVFATIGVFGGLVPYYAVYRIIELFIKGQPDRNGILFWSLVCFAGYFVKQLFHTLSTMLSHISAYTILEQIRLKIAERLMKAPLGTVNNFTAGQIKNIMIDRVEDIELPLAHLIPELSSHLMLPIAIFTYLCTIDWRMALAALVTVPFAVVSVLILMKGFNKKWENYMNAYNHVNNVIIEYAEGIEVIKTFNQSAISYEKYARAVYSLKDNLLTWLRSYWPPMQFTAAVLPSSLLGTVPIGIALYQNGSLPPADFAISVIMSLGIVAPMMKFVQFINEAKVMEYGVKGASSLLNLVEMKNEGTFVQLPHHDIEFKDVSFSYNADDKNNVLEHLNLHIPEGEFSALVGPSGGGKSTIARLIVRFWNVNSGSITIGNVDIRRIPLSQLLQLITFVTQDNYLFDCSLKENIRLGRPDASDQEVYAAAGAAQCETFISQLKQGYDTPAGEAGKRLSGGEKQRISIARAILKNAPIVLLDEATAFTDPENEEKIQKSIAALTKGKTLLVIAHRLSTVADADRIVLLNKGKILDTGIHTELLENSPFYSHMWQAHIAAKTWTTGTKNLKEDRSHV